MNGEADNSRFVSVHVYMHLHGVQRVNILVKMSRPFMSNAPQQEHVRLHACCVNDIIIFSRTVKEYAS